MIFDLRLLKNAISQKTQINTGIFITAAVVYIKIVTIKILCWPLIVGKHFNPHGNKNCNEYNYSYNCRYKHYRAYNNKAAFCISCILHKFCPKYMSQQTLIKAK